MTTPGHIVVWDSAACSEYGHMAVYQLRQCAGITRRGLMCQRSKVTYEDPHYCWDHEWQDTKDAPRQDG